MTDIWISDLNKHTFLFLFFSVSSLVLVSTEKTYQSLETVLDRISKHLKVCRIYSTVRRIFNSRCLEMWSKTVFRV